MTHLTADLGSGPLSSKLWVIGRDYDAEEQRLGQPFQGPAGQVLNAALRAAGMPREFVRVDNLVPKQPPGNEWEAHAPGDVAWGLQRLQALLQQHKPQVVVGLGGEVAQWLLGFEYPTGEDIQDIRGYLWDTGGSRVLCTVHPAAVLREWTPWRTLLDLDLRRAVNELHNGTPALEHREVTIVTTAADAADLREAIHEASNASAGNGVVRAAVPQQRVANGWGQHHSGGAAGGHQPRNLVAHASQVQAATSVDIENTHDLELACVGFAPTPARAWVVPAWESWQRTLIAELCSAATPKVLQNGQYDRAFLRWFCGIELRGQSWDTQLAWHALQPELAGKKMQTKKRAYRRRTIKSLQFLSSVYTRDPFWKNYDFKTEEERYNLCGRDCCITKEIALKQARQLT